MSSWGKNIVTVDEDDIARLSLVSLAFLFPTLPRPGFEAASYRSILHQRVVGRDEAVDGLYPQKRSPQNLSVLAAPSSSLALPAW